MKHLRMRPVGYNLGRRDTTDKSCLLTLEDDSMEQRGTVDFHL